MVRVAIYVRVSTQEQAKEGYSITEQIQRLTKFSEAHDWFIVNTYVDAGYSGSNINRPALQDLIADVRSGKIDKVLVYKLDRLSRSQKDTLKLIEDVFLPNNTDFESMSEKLDTGTAQGRLFLGILAAFAQLEREMIKERMSMGIDARIKEGKWKGGAHIPFGYDYDPDQNKLIINAYDSMIVKMIFTDFTSGKSIGSIEQKMIENGYTFKSGNSDRRTIKYVLRNKTYCGYQKHKTEWLPALHDPIIDESTYEKAQIILDANRQKFEESGYKAGSNSYSSILGGLIYCGKCGSRFSKAQTGTKKYGYHFNYMCHSRHKKLKSMINDPTCKNKIYKMNVLDNIVFDEIKKLAIDPEYINQIKSRSDHDDSVQKIQIIEKKIKSINDQISRFMDLYGIGNFTIKELDEKVAPLQDQRSKLNLELERLKKDTKRISEKDAIKLVTSFDDVIENGSLQDKRTIIEQLIDKIIINDDDITIYWNFI